MERTCKKCGETKSIEKFIKNKTCKFGRGYICHSCKYIQRKQKPGFAFQRKQERKKNYCFEKRKRVRERFALVNHESVKISEHKRQIKNTKEINDSYVKLLLLQSYGIHGETAKKYPELIESYRQQIKVKRLLKQKKNENTETS